MLITCEANLPLLESARSCGTATQQCADMPLFFQR